MWSFVLVIAVYFAFLINIPFYLFWLKKQKTTSEAFLYNVEGRYSYNHVLDLINRIEVVTKKKLPKERRIILIWKQNCDRRNVPLIVYKKKIHRLLKDEAFGENMATTAFKRMPMYSKIMALLNIGIFFSIFNAVGNSFATDSEGATFFTGLTGIILGFIPAAPAWFLAHSIFNYALKYSAEQSLKKNKSAGYFQIAMAHFYGFFLGVFWKDLMWENKQNDFLLGPKYYGYGYGIGGLGGFGSGSSYSGFGSFGGGGFGGGGAGGDW